MLIWLRVSPFFTEIFRPTSAVVPPKSKLQSSIKVVLDKIAGENVCKPGKIKTNHASCIKIIKWLADLKEKPFPIIGGTVSESRFFLFRHGITTTTSNM